VLDTTVNLVQAGYDEPRAQNFQDQFLDRVKALPGVESAALARDLKRRGFRFVGPTTVYAMMQAVGVVNDHLAACFVRDEVEALRVAE